MKFQIIFTIIGLIMFIIVAFYLFYPTNGFLNRTDMFLIQIISDGITSLMNALGWEKLD